MKRLFPLFATVSAVLLVLGSVGCTHSSSSEESAPASPASYTVAGSLVNDGTQTGCGSITITLSGETFSDTAAAASDFSSYFTSVGTAVSGYLKNYALTGSVSTDRTVLTLTVGGSAISAQSGSISISSIPAALLASGTALSGSGSVPFEFTYAGASIVISSETPAGVQASDAEVTLATATLTLSQGNTSITYASSIASDQTETFAAIKTALAKYATVTAVTAERTSATVLTLTVTGTADKATASSDCTSGVFTATIGAFALTGGLFSDTSATVYAGGSVSIKITSQYMTSSSFDKWAEAISGTSSALGSLDTTEPADLANCSVNMTELRATLDTFDDEDELLPKVKVTYDNNASKWVIFYTTDATLTAGSEYTLATESYAGLLDAVNKSFSYLTSGRTSKEKVLVEASGSTGTAAINTNSAAYRTTRIAGTPTIDMHGMSNIILDFGGNTIYVDTSEANSSGKNIQAFIDMERSAHDISIRNLFLTGSPSYGIFMAQAYNIVCANIHFAKAKDENVGPSIGIRPQSQDNAKANVALDRWSHDLYFKNISGNGMGEHVVETFNAYNVYMDEIKGVDIGGNAVLLNGTYSATIGTITGIRCCTGGGYAAFRCANDVGPDVNVHYVYSEACGRGLFFVSSITGVTIDKVNVLNAVQGILYNSCEFIDIRSGKIQTNGGTINYYDSSVENNTASYATATKTAQTSEAILLTTATSSQYLPEYHNTFQNLTFTGFNKTVNERTYMCANYNTYTESGTPSYVTDKGSSYTGTAAGIWNIVNGTAGNGNNATSGSAVTENGFTGYQSTKTSGYVITGYSGTGGAIEIPATLGGAAVTEIGDFAFWKNTSITSVTIPSSVVLIGDLAFADCTALTTLTINGTGGVEIDAAAFRGCTALTSVDLTGVKYLRHAAFANCTALTAVTCPDTLVYFGANCFYNDDVALTIEAADSSAMTMEPYAFFFIGRNATITFTGISAAPSTLTSMPASGNNPQYLYNCQEYLEDTVYTAGTWCYYWYHVAVAPTFN
ncbi:MAG: leucine-rich repeat domain-containing protein [Treponema sp.]|nr:leucine-rich repeat domain-containing protein [Treponema sp.]